DPARKQTAGFPPWSEDDVAAYERRWPIGTPQRVWLDVLLYTGLHRGDAARLGRQHIRHGVASLATEKTGTTVALPIAAVARRRPLRRFDIHRRRQGTALPEGELRQCLCGSRPCRRRPQILPWLAQDRGHTLRREWRYGPTDECYL